jgi:hypothetical protein
MAIAVNLVGLFESRETLLDIVEPLIDLGSSLTAKNAFPVNGLPNVVHPLRRLGMVPAHLLVYSVKLGIHGPDCLTDIPQQPQRMILLSHRNAPLVAI